VGLLVLVRHGETEWNTASRYQGQQDIPLSPQGREQVEVLAEFFRDWPLDAVYASDLKRAYDTAAAIAQVHQLPVKADIRLREYAFGVWEGLTRSEIKIKYPELYYGRRQNIDIQIPGGETGSQVQIRAFQWLKEVAASNLETVIAVSHGGTIRTLIAKILDVDIIKCHRLRLDNCGFTIITWEKGEEDPEFFVHSLNSRVSPNWF
jgi:broad specificity phosphatase PhoE